MEKNYSQFHEISIYDTGLVRKSSYVAGVFKKNNIENLEQLFRLDDELGINYGANTYANSYGNCQHVRSQIRGIIKLIRYKYLKEELFADTIYDNNYNLESRYFEGTYIPADPSTYPPRFSEFLNRDTEGMRLNVDFKKLGFNDNEIEIICKCAYKTSGSNFEFGSMFLKVAEEIMETFKEYNQYAFSNKSEQSIFIEKVGLISNYIKNDKRLDTTVNIKELMEEEKRLILELNELNERSMQITNKIGEIQEKLKSNKSIR